MKLKTFLQSKGNSGQSEQSGEGETISANYTSDRETISTELQK